MKNGLSTFLSVTLWSISFLELNAAGGPGYALSFDGDDDRVQALTNSFPAAFNSFTIELWVNPTGFRAPTVQTNVGILDINQRFAVFPDHGDSYGVNHACAGLSIGTNGISVFEHASNYLPSPLVYSANLSGWTHVALVYVNKQPRIYVNGTLAHTGLTSTKAAVHPSASLGGSIHALGYGPFQGRLDEVRIWNGPLNQFQIQEYMNRSLTGTEAGLVVYYRCDEGALTLLTDSAPANPANHGTLVNGTAWVPSGVQPFSPFAQTLPASAAGAITNTLNGRFNPAGTNTSVWFEWGLTTNYGNQTPTRAIGSGTSNTNLSEILVGVDIGITYHFRAVASNGLGVALGSNLRFTTPVVIDVTQPGDSIELVNGANDGDADAGPPPSGEGVEHAIDNAGQKYLNFLDHGSGLAVQPRVGPTLVTGLRLYTANDVEARDPASYLLEASTVGLAGPWTTLASGSLALPPGRNDGGRTPPGEYFQEVTFSNSVFYAAYRLTFPTLKDATAASSMQIGEVELLGVPKRLNVRKVESGLITISWGDPGTLEEAFSVTGAFSDVPAATAPYSTTPSAQMKFFRLRMEAQGYSPNAVAYVNHSLQPGLNLIQNPLDATVAGGNTVSNLLASVPDGTTVYKWTLGTGFTVNDHTSLFGWTDPQMTMAPGEGVVVYLPGTSVFTSLFVGEVMQGTLATALAQGFNLVGSWVPQAGKLSSDLGYVPVESDLVYQWDPQTGYKAPSDFEFGTWTGGDPNIAVAEVFWLGKTSAGSWTRNFSINP